MSVEQIYKQFKANMQSFPSYFSIEDKETLLNRMISCISKIGDPVRCNEMRMQLMECMQVEADRYNESYKQSNVQAKSEEEKKDESLVKSILRRTKDLENFPSMDGIWVDSDIVPPVSPPPPNMVPPVPPPPPFPNMVPPVPPPPVFSQGTKEDIKSNITGVQMGQLEEAQRILIKDGKNRNEKENGDLKKKKENEVDVGNGQ